MQTRAIKQIRLSLALLVITALLVGAPALAAPQSAPASRLAAAPVAAPVLAAPVTINLCAEASTGPSDGHLTMPDATVIPIWGFSDGGFTGNCADVSAIPSLPGPTLTVNQGDEVTVNLYNQLSENVSITFHGQGQGLGLGQSLPADTVGAAPCAGPCTPGSPGATYTFTASQAGTFLYEAGLTANGAKQVAMGLHGALIVLPTIPPTTYTNEKVLVLSEIDPALNCTQAPGVCPPPYDVSAPLDILNYAPKYWLMNGESHPDTDLIQAPAGTTLLVRYVNAGLTEHSMGLLGLDQTVIAKDGHARPAFRAVSETLAAGQTMDTLINMPAAVGAKYPLYDTSRHLDNNGTANGGMMTFLEVGAPPPVVVTVSNTSSIAQSGLNLYAFSGATYTGMSGVTNGSGQVSFTLASGSYNFRADKNGTQFFSGGASGVNTCTVPGCTSDSVTVTDPVVVTVVDDTAPTPVPQSGLNVYAFAGATYTGYNGVTDASGQVTFTLPLGSYNFRADKNGTQFFSGGASGVNTCTVSGCTSDNVTVTTPVVVTVVDDTTPTPVPQSGLNVYAFAGATYTGHSGVTALDGTVSFTLVPGDYNFRADVGSSQYFSGGASGVNTCTVSGCTSDSVTVTVP